jgi:hypothetical protein
MYISLKYINIYPELFAIHSKASIVKTIHLFEKFKLYYIILHLLHIHLYYIFQFLSTHLHRRESHLTNSPTQRVGRKNLPNSDRSYSNEGETGVWRSFF